MRKSDRITNDIFIVEDWIKQYGNIDIETLIKHVQGNKIYECPVCKGVGQNAHKDNTYPWQDCKVCEGNGYTEKMRVPKMEQSGWE